MSLAAYQRVAKVTETTRQTEYRLLGDVCRELTAAAADTSAPGRRREALDWNRRVWTLFMIDCGQVENTLPIALRAKIVSLGLWVSRYTEEAMWSDLGVQPLIDVNTSMMKGLMGNPQVAS